MFIPSRKDFYKNQDNVFIDVIDGYESPDDIPARKFVDFSYDCIAEVDVLYINKEKGIMRINKKKILPSKKS